jgi:hypothetical protein
MASLYPLPLHLKLVFLYNSVATTLWFCCLARFLILLPLVGPKFLPGGIADFFHVVALIPLIGFFVERINRYRTLRFKDSWILANGLRMIWICYGVIFPYPIIAKHPSYSLLIISWCLSCLIHYSYHAFRIKTRGSPYFLFWSQYNNHYLTFPLGLIAEMILVFLSLKFVIEDLIYEYVLKTALLAYIPLAYFTWGYLQQRKQVRFVEIMQKRNAIRRAQDGQVSVTVSSITESSQDHELRAINN